MHCTTHAALHLSKLRTRAVKNEREAWTRGTTRGVVIRYLEILTSASVYESDGVDRVKKTVEQIEWRL